MKLPLFLLTALLTGNLIQAQPSTPCPCCTEHHAAFDFWVGEWVVRDTLGAIVGENSITKIQDNCALEENWTSAAGGTGTSYNYYNAQDSTWNQLWIDNRGTTLVLKGGVQNNAMILQSEWFQGKDGQQLRHRITWTPDETGTVTQKWDVLNDAGQTVRTLFVGVYTRK